MTKLTFTLRAIILSALCVPVVFSCSNYLDFQEDIGNLKKDGEKTFQVSVHANNAEEGEAVLADVPLATEGATITLTASLNAGRRVALSADGVVITPSTISADGDTATFTMPSSAVIVTATFSDIPPTLYAITVTPSGAEAGESVTTSVSEAAEGTTITLTASLGVGRRVALSADGVVIDPSTINTDSGTATFTMPGNAVEVTATFYSVYAITITPTGATGSEAVTASVSTAAQGTTITLTAALGAGRRVVLSAAGVTITPSTISTSGDTATFTMPANAVTVTATFSYYAGGAVTHTASTKTFNMHYVPSGGTFIMGQNVVSPTQTVTLTKNFWMGETEVTQGLWEAVAGSWPGAAPSRMYGDGDNKPAYNVNWYDAVAFCNKLTIADDSIADSEQVYYSDATFTTPYTSGTTVYADLSKKGYRLPTEAEWEYAARYIDGTIWNHGNHASGDTEYACHDAASCSHTLASDARIGEYAWYSGNNSGSGGDPMYGSKDVGQKTANALGLRDMSGNVLEWCYDWYEAYSGSSETDPTGASTGSYRVRRGGYWYLSALYLRCADRYISTSPESRFNHLGFRLCRTAD